MGRAGAGRPLSGSGAWGGYVYIYIYIYIYDTWYMIHDIWYMIYDMYVYIYIYTYIYIYIERERGARCDLGTATGLLGLSGFEVNSSVSWPHFRRYFQDCCQFLRTLGVVQVFLEQPPANKEACTNACCHACARLLAPSVQTQESLTKEPMPCHHMSLLMQLWLLPPGAKPCEAGSLGLLARGYYYTPI